MKDNFESNSTYAMDLRVKYEKELSDNGSFSTLYLFRDTDIDRYLVAKCLTLPKQLEEYFEFFSNKFKEEAEFLINVSHENIVKAFSYGYSNILKRNYYLMEYIEGDTLAVYIRNNPENINDIFLKLCEVFEWIHERGIVHGDIKENNILVNKDGLLKIIDFGLSKKISSDSSLFTVFDNVPALNRTYSDEEWTKVYNYKTDVFHLGKMFEKLSDGLSGFKYKNIVEKMVMHNDKQRISIKDVKNLIINQDTRDYTITPHVQLAIDNIIKEYPIDKFKDEAPVKNDISFESFMQNCNEFITSRIRAKDFYDMFFQPCRNVFYEYNSISKYDINTLLSFMKETDGFFAIFKKNVYKLIDNTEIDYDLDDLPF